MAENLRFNLNVDTNEAVSAINTFFSSFDAGAAKAEGKLRKAFNQKLQTEIQLTVKGEKVVAEKVKKIGTDSERISTAIKAMNGEFGKTPGQVNRALQALKALRDNTAKLDQKTGKVSASWRLVAARIDEAKQAAREFGDAMPKGGKGGGGMAALGDAFTAAGIKARLASEAIMMFTGAIKSVTEGMIDRARELEQLNVALQAFTRDGAQAEAIMKTAQMTGLAYGVSIQSVERAWKRVGPAAAAAGLSLGETNDIITSATARMARMGLNTEQAGRYMEALAQVMGKGKLQGEELRQQFSELDGALRTQIASFLQARYGIVDLDEAMMKGQVSAKMFAEGLVSISQGAVQQMASSLGNLNTQFESLNLEQKFQNIGNLATVAKQEWGEIFGPFGESLLRITTMVTGWIAGFKEKFPNLAKEMEEAWAKMGESLEMIIYGLLILIDKFALGMEKLKESGVNLMDQVINQILPGFLILKQLGGDKILDQMWSGSVEKAREYVGTMSSVGDTYGTTLQLQQELLNGQKAGTDEANATSDALRAQKEAINSLKIKHEETANAAKNAKKAYDGQKEKVEEIAASIKARYDLEISQAQNAAGIIKSRIDQEKADYQALRQAVKDRYDQEKRDVNDIYEKKLAALDLEADRLRGRTPSEQALYELEKEKLQDKIESGRLDEEELLRANARLERMNRQEQLEKLSIERKNVQAQKEKEIKDIEEEKRKELDKIKKNYDDIMKDLKDQLQIEKDKVKELRDGKAALDDIKNNTKIYTGDLETGVTHLQNQAGKLEDMERIWQRLKTQADNYNTALQNALTKQSQLQQPTAPPTDTAPAAPPNAYSGGPVSGGSWRTVNELGKEAFLSASGRLSMINAPAWGKWQAPSSGTIIPAHLTRQLDIPTGGININKGAGMRAMNTAGLVNKIASQASGGDVYHQNVTVQSSNPTQTANNMMVEMTRLKRRRFR